jgi:hypothetical protein
MRQGLVKYRELTAKIDNVMTLDLMWNQLVNWQDDLRFDQKSLTPFKIFAEMKFRYDLKEALKRALKVIKVIRADETIL